MPGTNVALHAYALCLVHTWSHLTSSVRVLAGQALESFKYTTYWWLGTGGGGYGRAQFGSVYVDAQPGMRANGHVMQICLPETRAHFLHIAMRPLQPPRRGGHVDMRMSV